MADIFKKMAKAKKKAEMFENEWYSLRSILGYWWAIFLFLIGGREAGKSYAVTEFFVRQFVKKGRPFYWLRLTDTSQRKLLNNNAEKLIDPDIRRKYNLDIWTNGDGVYVVERDDKGKITKKTLMARVLALSTFYNDKGSGLFDKDFLKNKKMYYNICLDEMNREASEKNSFDIVYAFVNQLENLVRSTKYRIRVICIGNTLEEASDIMCAFNFLPIDFGRYKLVKNKAILKKYLYELENAKDEKEVKSINKRYSSIDFGKRAVVEYIEPSEAYKNRRHGTIADILMPSASTFSNKIETDSSLVYTGRLVTPQQVIKFFKDPQRWFTVWDGNIITRYNGEKVNRIAMRPYLDEMFNTQLRDNIINIFDTRGFAFKDLITFKLFQKELELLKPRKGA